MSRENLTPPAYARLHQLQLAQAVAQCLKRSAINDAVFSRGVHRRRLVRGVGGDQQRVLARRLRRNATSAERALWALVRRRRLGVKFRRKAWVQGRIVDFFVPALMLVVELEGPVHRAVDARARIACARDAYLRGRGYEVIRFTNKVVCANNAKSCTNFERSSHAGVRSLANECRLLGGSQ